MHVQPPPPHWTQQLTSGIETAGKAYTLATTMYHVGKGIGTAFRVAQKGPATVDGPTSPNRDVAPCTTPYGSSADSKRWSRQILRVVTERVATRTCVHARCHKLINS